MSDTDLVNNNVGEFVGPFTYTPVRLVIFKAALMNHRRNLITNCPELRVGIDYAQR